jgi:hypothetical protein
MAEIDARQVTNIESSPRVRNPASDYGKIIVACATTPATAAWAQNDTFSTGIIIPKGSRILRSGRLSHGALGSSVTMDVGIRAVDDGTVVDVDGIADGLDVAAAGVKELDGGSLFASGVGYVTTEDVEVYCSLLTANPTDNIQFELEVHFLPSAS